ncbi:unnamed protein product, partial [Cyprideis torosa]
MQAIAMHFGGKLKNLNAVVHGIDSTICRTTDRTNLFEGIPKEFIAGRYHSWVVDAQSLPHSIHVTAEDLS